MELPVEIIQSILTNVSFQDACKAKMISRSWRAVAVDILRRHIFQKKKVEELVKFFAIKLQKEAKKFGRKNKFSKEDLAELLTFALNTDTLFALQAGNVGFGRIPDAVVRLWLYAEDEMGLWEHFDDVIAKSDKVHIGSPFFRSYFQLRCSALYELGLDLLDDAIDEYADLDIEVDPTKDGKPENVQNLIKVCKQYFDALFVEFRKKIDKETLGWLQHVYKKEPNINSIKIIIVLHLVIPSILSQASDRDIHLKKGSKKPKKDPYVRMRKYVLVCKILSSAMLGNKHKEEFLSGADAFTLQVAEQLENVTKELLATKVDRSKLFQPYSISVADIFEALTAIKEQKRKLNN